MEQQSGFFYKIGWVIAGILAAILVIILTCLYNANVRVTKLTAQLEEVQNTELTTAGEQLTVRIMDGIVQQLDDENQWIDVAPVDELQQEDPVLLGTRKMQQLIQENRDAVASGAKSVADISEIALQMGQAAPILAAVSGVETVSSKKSVTSQSKKPAQSSNKPAVTNSQQPTTQQPQPENTVAPSVNNGGNSSGGSSDSGSSSGGGNSDSGSSSGGGSSDSGSSSGGGSSDSGSSSGGGSSDSGSSSGGGSSDSGSSGGDSSDSGSSGDGEDIGGWTDDIL